MSDDLERKITAATAVLMITRAAVDKAMLAHRNARRVLARLRKEECEARPRCVVTINTDAHPSWSEGRQPRQCSFPAIKGSAVCWTHDRSNTARARKAAEAEKVDKGRP